MFRITRFKVFVKGFERSNTFASYCIHRIILELIITAIIFKLIITKFTPSYYQFACLPFHLAFDEVGHLVGIFESLCMQMTSAGSDHPKYNGCLMKKCFSRIFYYCLGNACGLFGMTTSSLGHVTWIFCLRATGYTRRDSIEGHSQQNLSQKAPNICTEAYRGRYISTKEETPREMLR